MPFVKTPYLLIASQSDAYQLVNNIGHWPRNDAEKAYEADFAARTAQLMRSLHDNCTTPLGCAVFSWNCASHAVSGGSVAEMSARRTGSSCDPLKLLRCC